MGRSQTMTKPLKILLVEDNQGDVVLTEESLAMSGFQGELFHVENGRDALAFLRKEAAYTDKPSPDLVLLDLNMPIMNGDEMLAEMLEDERISHTPVLVLTTSSSPDDIKKMYRLRCNSYIVKPIDFQSFLDMTQWILTYWQQVAQLPNNKH